MLLDIDSVFYKAVYKCVSFSDIREIVKESKDQDTRLYYESEVTRVAISRVYKKVHEITQYIEENFCELYRVEMFMTTCTNNFRNEIEPNYKKSRKGNSRVRDVREFFKGNNVEYSDTLEADDLIANRARELGKDNCLIASIDKDLKQIGGNYWSFYTKSTIDDRGFRVSEYKQKEPIFISEEEADKFLWSQMLIGDNVDDIKGIKGIGVKRADKLLRDATNNFIAVAREYIKKGEKDRFYTNLRLLTLGD